MNGFGRITVLVSIVGILFVTPNKVGAQNKVIEEHFDSGVCEAIADFKLTQALEDSDQMSDYQITRLLKLHLMWVRDCRELRRFPSDF